MDTILYLVRHVESSPNDVVTESGLQQAQSLANALSKTEIDLIISSPYQRAIDTVKPFSEIARVPIQINDGLKERKVSEGLIGNFLDV
ncbi:MAG: histidine phosphatase family protein, partial [bacterium]